MILFKPRAELTHYASKYYDPESASIYNKEYYEAHKQLKGRRSTKSLNDEGKMIWEGVKENVIAERKRVQKAVQKQKSDEIKAFKERVRAEQKARAKVNSDYFKSQIKKSMAEEKARIAAVSEANTKDILDLRKTARLKRIPRTASKAQKERLRLENDRISANNERIHAENDRIRSRNDSIRKQNKAAKSQIKSTKDSIKEDYREVRADYKEECKEILDGVKEYYREKISAGTETIKEKYVGSSDEIKQKYETILDEEYEKILSAFGANTVKGQNTGGVERTAEERRKIRQELAAEREKKRKKK